MSHKLALIGFGTVAQGLAEILLRRGDLIRQQYGTDFSVVAIADTVKGSIYDPQGLDLAEVMNSLKSSGTLDQYPQSGQVVAGWDSLTTIRESNADTVIEATFTNVVDGQPGLDHCRRALETGKNVVTTNKGPIALAYEELQSLAESHGVRLLFEGTVMSGTPVLRLASTSLVGNEIQGVRGILNGTSNFILTKMDEGHSFEDALGEAQRLGYAEADPTADVDGYDAQYKLLILARTVFGVSLSREEIKREGIRGITNDQIADARRQNRRYKLIASLRRTSGGIRAAVGPEAIPLSDPLSGVLGAVNAVSFDCDLSGEVTVVGPGAGRTETGYALLVDCINMVRGQI